MGIWVLYAIAAVVVIARPFNKGREEALVDAILAAAALLFVFCLIFVLAFVMAT